MRAQAFIFQFSAILHIVSRFGTDNGEPVELLED